MATILNETVFEKHIADYLANSPMYNQRSPKDFDINKLVDKEMLLHFLREQSMWTKLVKGFADEQDALNTIVDAINTKLNRGEYLLNLLKKGFMVQGRLVKLVEFKPEMSLDDDTEHLYHKNMFSVVRQMRYSTAGNDTNNELDLTILINGLPIITMELKNEATGQTVVNGMHQYQTDRNPQNRMLRTCLVHFAMDNNRVMMTTKLAKNETTFLPFNKETVNPPVEGEYPTCYMWQHILQADSLLNLIQHFIKLIQPKKGEPFYIFPRYHQLRCVRNIICDVRAKGIGQTYLVQHSAGSGKTKSMSWLAFQLANMQKADNTPVFDSVIMITDRIVLDRNIAKEIKEMEEVAGTVKDIRKGSKNLAKALEEGGHRIIISTEQKFSFALPKLKEAAGSHFAVIIDEAHTAFGKQASHDVRQILTDNKELKQTVDEFGIESRDEENNMQDQMLAELQAARNIKSGHISYFAFTATPKAQTFALYGRDGRAFDIYSMRQAIDEGFILDVLKNYTTFQTMFELTEKVKELEKGASDEDKSKYEKQNALKLMMQYVNSHPYVINYKANMMVDYFMEHGAQKINGQAKAIVVTSSRVNAVLYHAAIVKRLKEKYGDEVKALVAFSGEVDIDGVKYTEEKINGFGIKDNGIAEEFNQPYQKFLVVADKFQTGFDQPLLHTMFVDRLLGGVQCIQTLSRLNRCYEGKEDTMIIDFVNKHENVKKAFEPYYEATYLEGNYNTSNIYEYKDDIEKRKLFNQADVDNVVNILLSNDESQLAGLTSIMERLVNEYVRPLDEETQGIYRKEVNRYIRQYGLLAQLMTFLDPELERFYMFCKLYYKFLPYTKETLPMDILNKIDLDKYRVQLAEEGCISLEEENGVLIPPGTAGVNSGEKDFETLESLIHMVNEPYEGFLNENDQIILELLRQLKNDPGIKQAFSVSNSIDSLKKLLKEKFNQKAAEQLGKYVNLMKLMNSNQAFNEEFFSTVLDIMLKFTKKSTVPEFNEELLKNAMMEKLESTFEDLCGSAYRELEEVLDSLFAILKTTTIPNLDGLNTILPDLFNKYYRGENEPVDLKIIFSSLLPKYEAYLRKLYYLKTGDQLGPHDGWIPVVKKFPVIQGLHYDNNPKLSKFHTYYEAMYNWRNNNVHEAPYLPDTEVSPAIHMVVSMYVFATMISIADLEMAGYDIDETRSTINPLKTEKKCGIYDFENTDNDSIRKYGMVAEPINIGKQPEQTRLEILRKSIVKLINYGYTKKTSVFTKQRHWESIYRIAADYGFVIDGDYAYFKSIIDRMKLDNLPALLNRDFLDKYNNGIYAKNFEDWTNEGLTDRKLKEYEDIKHCAEVFKGIVDENIPQKLESK
ncbi:MAG: type I restriction endonuclease [Bacteroides sp.]|jgi:type I restriction enzyme R subunit|nr:type I restriction endonuclease [Bacteroides sp.]